MNVRLAGRFFWGALLLSLSSCWAWRYVLDPQRELERRINAQPDGVFTLAGLWSGKPAPTQWRLLGPYADASACGEPCAEMPRWVPECESWWIAMRGDQVLTVQRVQCNRGEWPRRPPASIAIRQPLQMERNAAGRRQLRLL